MNVSTSTTFRNSYEAYQAAVKAIRKQGFRTAQNLRSVCGMGACGCSGFHTPKSWGEYSEATNYAYSKRGQLTWYENDRTGNRYSYDTVPWFFKGENEADTSIAELMVTTFNAYGFPVEWKGTADWAVVVDVKNWDGEKITA